VLSHVQNEYSFKLTPDIFCHRHRLVSKVEFKLEENMYFGNLEDERRTDKEGEQLDF
jgi:hypothetical protein